MRVSASMESLWRYIDSLSLSKRSQGMLEEPQEEYISKEEVLEKIDSGLKDVKAGRTKTYEEFMRDWNDEV